jgi:hypothetical protein
VLRRSLFALVVGAVVGGCVTPSIPIPPPEPERMTFTIDTQAGAASFAYAPEPNYADAVVYVFNRDRGQGVITTARPDGSVGPTAPFPATVGDQIAVTFETADSIAGTCVQINSDGSAGFCN